MLGQRTRNLAPVVPVSGSWYSMYPIDTAIDIRYKQVTYVHVQVKTIGCVDQGRAGEIFNTKTKSFTSTGSEFVDSGVEGVHTCSAHGDVQCRGVRVTVMYVGVSIEYDISTEVVAGVE